MTATLPYFSAAQVHGALDFPTLIEALAQMFAADAKTPLRHAHTVHDAQGAKLLLMPAWQEGEAIAVKVVTVFPGNRSRGAATVGATVLLLDGKTGHPKALMDGESLTLRRTGAASALASRYLSRPDSRTLLLVGAGNLAPYLALAHCAVRPIQRLLVWARRADAAAACAQACSKAIATELRSNSVVVTAVSDLDEAVASADLISCATTSTEPLVRGAKVRAGTHVDLVGAFTPQMRESDDELIVQSKVFVDTFAGALTEAGDLTQALSAQLIDRSHVLAQLSDLVMRRHPGRRSANETTVFKSVGTALEDLAAAQLVVAKLGDDPIRSGLG